MNLREPLQALKPYNPNKLSWQSHAPNLIETM